MQSNYTASITWYGAIKYCDRKSEKRRDSHFVLLVFRYVLDLK